MIKLFHQDSSKKATVMKIKFIYIALLSFISITAISQERKVAKATKQYDRFAYVDAIETYERIAKKGFKSVDMLKQLGDSYYFNGKLDKAAEWYNELFGMTQDLEPEYYFRYAQALKSINDYKKADEMMVKFAEKNGQDSRGVLAKSQKNYLEEIKKNSGRYNIENAGINSAQADFGSAFYNDKVVFVSSRDTGNFAKRKHSWTGQYFTRIYSADMTTEGNLSNVAKFARQLDSKFHESTPVFTKDGKTVYFTRNNYVKKRGFSEEKVTLLKIYKATLEGDKWTNVTSLPFNSDSYQVAHPALSPDEKTLYFASDMPGTLGLSDIFKVEIKGDGSFGEPVNLGPSINTPGRETFPFVSGKNELYFATDGYPGLGGLDIFASRIQDDGKFTAPQNIGEPANSPSDDFAYIINSTSKRGFLSSNRTGGNGDDDIYKFLETKELEFTCEQSLSGIVTDLETNLPLANAKVTLFDDKFTKLKEVFTDKDGKYDFGEVECGKKYFIRTEMDKYTTFETPITIAKESGKTELPIQISPSVKKVKVGDDLRTAFGIEIIYFDLDKWNIRPDAAVELAKILDVLEQNPTMKIDIRSHTDSRQTHKYNEKLSDRRAKSTMAWLIEKGIDKSRLSAKGYGETQLVNKCADGVECSEADHQLNRRSEFIIVDL